MKHLLSIACLMAAATQLGCSSNSSSARDFDDYEEPAPQTTVREVEIEVEEEKSDDNPFAFLQFWKWFDEDDKPAAAAEPARDVDVEFEEETEDKYSEFAQTEKKKAKWYAPWTWFDGDDDVRQEEIEVERVEFVEEEDDRPFWKKWFDRDDDKPRRITEREVLGDMSPELTSLAETKGEGKIRTAHVHDTNTRMIWDDLRMFFMLDRPSRLSMYPVP